MRLIDADKMLERLEEWNTSDAMDKALYNFAFMRIREQPTAYNIEKVIDELKEKYYSCDLESYEVDGSEYEDGRFDAYNDAIKIVEKGGTEDVYRINRQI